MFCNKCESSSPPLTETFVNYCQPRSIDSHLMRRQQVFCNNCLVGQVVPAFRTSIGRWNLGRVIACCQETSEFFLVFEWDEKEWVRLESSPYRAYVANYHHCDKHVDLNSGEHWTESDEYKPEWIFAHCKSPKHKDHEEHQGLDDSGITRQANELLLKEPFMELDNFRTDWRDNFYSTKSRPRLWTEEEDGLLRSAMHKASKPIKWPEVARSIPHRTGKQCRERYYNHLMPNVKVTEWSPLEDALICHLYSRLSSKWATIAKFLPGRSDNSVKNRFHYIRRQLEKFIATTDGHNGFDTNVHFFKRVREAAMQTVITSLEDWADIIATTLLSSQQTEEQVLSMDDYGYSFGPFRHPVDYHVCQRCALCVPSSQTGSKFCHSTGWCETCARTSSYLSDEILRLHHVNLKRHF